MGVIHSILDKIVRVSSTSFYRCRQIEGEDRILNIVLTCCVSIFGYPVIKFAPRPPFKRIQQRPIRAYPFRIEGRGN